MIVAVNFRSTVSIAGFPAPIPSSRAFVYGAFRDVDEGETHHVPFKSFWGLFVEESALANPDDALFLTALMEWDDGNADALRNIVAGSVNSAPFASLNVTDRPARVGLIMDAFNGALQTPTGFPSTDEWVGLGQELRFSSRDVALTESGNTARQSLRFRGDGGDLSR